MLLSPLFAGAVRLLLALVNSPPLKRGDQGPEIALLQRAFVAMGYAMPRSTRSDGSMDGVFGGEMEDVVKKFQKRHGLLVKGYADGIIGTMTLTLIDTLISAIPNLLSPSISTPGGEVPRPHTPSSLPPSNRMTRPSSAKLRAAYEEYRTNSGKPCQRGITNQCAIRMSVALHKVDCGFSFASYRHPGAVHSGQGRCGNTLPHIDNATSLVGYLQELGLVFETYKRKTGTNAEAMEIKTRLTERKGIVYFKHCFNGGKGSHVDFWDGAHVMNKVWGYSGPGEPPTSDGFFKGTETKIMFCPTA